MSRLTLRYRVLRSLGRTATRTAATLTLFSMPPFVSASAVVADGDRLLVVMDPIRREPTLPGGHLRWTEKPEDAVIREVREETGLTISVDELFDVFAGDEFAGESGIVRVIYTASVSCGKLVSSGEGEAAWLPLSAVSNLMQRDAPIVRLWLQKKVNAAP